MNLSESPLSRRAVIGGGAAAAVALSVAPATSAWARPLRLDYPFTLGVASGDPEATSVVLWTRLAPEAVQPGPRDARARQGRRPVGGGAPTRGCARGEAGQGDDVRRVGALGARRGQGTAAGAASTGTASRPPGTSAPSGAPGRRPRRAARVAGLSFASVSCQAYDYGFFTSYPHIVDDDPDFVLHLGRLRLRVRHVRDGREPQDPGAPRSSRRRPGPSREWRATHALYKQDPNLQEAHRLLPFV